MSISDTSRSNIFARLERALERGSDAVSQENTEKFSADDKTFIEKKFSQLTQNIPSSNPVDVSARMDEEQLIEVFTRAAHASSAKVDVLTSIVDLPRWLAEKRDEVELPIYRQKTSLLDFVDWQSEPDLLCTTAYTLSGQWGIVEANCAIAETGSVVLSSAENHPVASGFLPDKLAVVVDSKTLVASLEDIWPIVMARRADKSKSTPPRALNIITGPSRTADVEQKVQLGAHGPRELYVAIVDV